MDGRLGRGISELKCAEQKSKTYIELDVELHQARLLNSQANDASFLAVVVSAHTDV